MTAPSFQESWKWTPNTKGVFPLIPVSFSFCWRTLDIDQVEVAPSSQLDAILWRANAACDLPAPLQKKALRVQSWQCS